MVELGWNGWLLAILAAAGIGISKSGLAGVSLVHVLVFAFLFGARDSTGILLPMLIIGDVCAVTFFGKKAIWGQVRKLMPPALVGVFVAWVVMHWLKEDAFRPIIGVIILSLTLLQISRLWRPQWFEKIPHSMVFAWMLGLLAGFTTMLANAAGPIVALYLIAISLPKHELVGTSAWFFLLLNLIKVPFSATLGLIRPETLMLNIVLAPAIIAGLFGGGWIVKRIPQKTFDALLLLFSAVASLRLMGFFSWVWELFQ